MAAAAAAAALQFARAPLAVTWLAVAAAVTTAPGSVYEELQTRPRTHSLACLNLAHAIFWRSTFGTMENCLTTTIRLQFFPQLERRDCVGTYY